MITQRKPRTIKPYHRKFDGWWYACSQRFVPVYGTERVKLHKGEKNEDNRQVATVELRKMLDHLESDTLADDMPIVVLADKYLAWLQTSACKGQGVKPRTFQNRKEMLEDFCAMHGNKTVGEFNKLGLHYMDQWLASHKGWKRSDTRRGAIAQVKACFNYGHTWLGQRKPELAKFPLPDMVARETYFTPEQEAAILEEASPDFRDFFSLLIGTGARPLVEAANFRVENLVMRDGEPIAFDMGKVKRRNRVVYLSPCMRVLVKRRLEVVKSGPLFLTKAGKPWGKQNSQSRFRRIRKHLIATRPELGLTKGHVLYSARHTYAYRMLQRHPVALTAEAMGNTIQVFERHYKKWINRDMILTALEALAQ